MPGLFEQLLAGVADDGAELLVDAQEPALGVRVGDADRGVLERAAEPLLALAQRLLGPLALGDIFKNVDRPRLPSLLVIPRAVRTDTFRGVKDRVTLS